MAQPWSKRSKHENLWNSHATNHCCGGLALRTVFFLAATPTPLSCLFSGAFRGPPGTSTPKALHIFFLPHTVGVRSTMSNGTWTIRLEQVLPGCRTAEGVLRVLHSSPRRRTVGTRHESKKMPSHEMWSDHRGYPDPFVCGDHETP